MASSSEKRDDSDSHSDDCESNSQRTTIEDFGYHFKEGRLLTIKDDAPFTFTTQADYVALGEVIEVTVYREMEKIGLKRMTISEEGRSRFIFVSPDYDKKDTVLVLIHGSGVVKAGQWARRLIINDCLRTGTQFEYIERGLARGMGVVVMNYNENCIGGGSKKCCEPSSHASFEWKYAMKEDISASNILVVAHSYGGQVISNCYKKFELGRDRVSFIALTDAWFRGTFKKVCNWDTRKKTVKRSDGVYSMYSGADTHEGTSAAAINSIFSVMDQVKVDTPLKVTSEMDDDSPKTFEDMLFEACDIIKAEMRDRRREEKETEDENEAVDHSENEEEKIVKKSKMSEVVNDDTASLAQGNDE